ncbi:SRPBCC family protein [Flavobacterium sp. SM15]|uniref:SRPBCC family protein n=1 Tax=Flavobacterium sp. SM15 TaxID=2908005 RepID=UPI001EDB950B|nr:SRPBCC family protein [Flavobacterium sp. SM15]MCG2610485.1 SRPBCC family protein [Flavobacterium sp. SM15]
MATKEKTTITVAATVNAPIQKVWEFWTSPEHITQWNNASNDWHTPWATNELKTGGKFSYRMEAKDGSFGFDFNGEYTEVKTNEFIEYIIADGRKVQIVFETNNLQTIVTETFEAEEVHPLEMQQDGWQAIINNFKRHVETN